LDEARESYKEEIVIELSSDSLDALEANVVRIAEFIANFKADAAKRGL
jgi:adenylate kinase